MVARVKSGEVVAYGPDLADVRISTAPAALDWRRGRLEYLDDALGYVVADVSRYTHKHIVLSNDEVSSLRFTGTVFEGGVDDWLASLPDIFPIDVAYVGDGTVELRPREPSKP